MNIYKQLNNFKNEFAAQTGVRLDFRTDKYLNNEYGLTPTFDYSFAEKIVEFTYDYLANHNVDVIYNLSMACDELRITRLKNFILDKLTLLENANQ